jgi:hypothetical protein
VLSKVLSKVLSEVDDKADDKTRGGLVVRRKEEGTVGRVCVKEWMGGVKTERRRTMSKR